MLLHVASSNLPKLLTCQTDTEQHGLMREALHKNQLKSTTCDAFNPVGLTGSLFASEPVPCVRDAFAGTPKTA